MAACSLVARDPEMGSGNDTGASDIPGGSDPQLSPRLCNMGQDRSRRRWSIVGTQARMVELEKRIAIRSTSPVRRGQHYEWHAAGLGSLDSADSDIFWKKISSEIMDDQLPSDQFDWHDAAAASDDHDRSPESSKLSTSDDVLPAPLRLVRLDSVEETTTSGFDQSASNANTPLSALSQSRQRNRNSPELFRVFGSNFSNSPGSRSDGTPTSATPKFISVTDTGPAPLLERGLSDNTAALAYKAGEGSSGMKETKMRESSRGLEVGAPMIPKTPKLHHVRRAPPLQFTSWSWPLRNEAEFERGVGELEGFGFDTLSFGSDDLCHLIQELFRQLDLPAQLLIPEEKIQKFILGIRDGMPANDYHSFHHVADVTQTLYALAKRTNLLEYLTPLDQFALLLAGLAHDLEHPGMAIDVANRTGQKQESNWRSNTSLEKHHSIRAFELMVDDQVGLLSNLDTNEYYKFRQSVVDIILATDMKRHGEYDKLVQSFISSRDGALGQCRSGTLDTLDSICDTTSRASSSEIISESRETPERAPSPTSLDGSCGQYDVTLENASASIAAIDPASTGFSRVSSTGSDQSVVVMVWGNFPKKKAMELLMKMADTSNVFKKFDVAKKWNLRVTDEFFHQGDVERQLGLPVTNMCDKELQTRVGLQIGFMRFIRPFHSSVAQIAGNLEDLIDELDANLRLFEGYDDERLVAELAQC